MTYAACGGDDDRTGDEREAIVHADLKRSFPAMTREAETLSMVREEQGAISRMLKSPAGSAPNYPGDCGLFPWGPKGVSFVKCGGWLLGPTRTL